MRTVSRLFCSFPFGFSAAEMDGWRQTARAALIPVQSCIHLFDEYITRSIAFRGSCAVAVTPSSFICRFRYDTFFVC